MMFSRVNRRTLLKGAAGTTAAAIASKHSTTFAAPAVIQSGPLEVLFWSSFGAAIGESLQTLVDDFNTSQTEIFINNQFQGPYDDTAQKLTAALQANAAPDLTILSEIWWFKFFLAGALQPLDDLIVAGNVDTADYVDSLINEGNRLGKQWWLPFARSTPLFYYNKDVFAEAGLTEAPKTWDEFAAAAPAMVIRDGNTLTRGALALPPAGAMAWPFQGMVWQFGGRYSDSDFNIQINESGAVDAGEFLKRSIADGWAYPAADAAADFINGLGAATMVSTGGLRTISESVEFNLGTAMLPEGPVGFGCCTGGSGMSILASAAPEKQAAAFEFMKFASNPEKTAWWSQNTGYMPVRKSAVESPEMQAFFAENPNFRTAVEQLPKTSPQDPARIYVPNGDQTIGEGLDRIMIEMEEVQVAFDDAAATLSEDAQPVLEQLEALNNA